MSVPLPPDITEAVLNRQTEAMLAEDFDFRQMAQPSALLRQRALHRIAERLVEAQFERTYWKEQINQR